MCASGDRPNQNRNREAATRADPIVDLAGNSLADGVRNQKPGCQFRKLQVRQVKLRGNDRRQNRNREAVDEVDERRKKDECDDPPAQSAHDESSGW